MYRRRLPLLLHPPAHPNSRPACRYRGTTAFQIAVNTSVLIRRCRFQSDLPGQYQIDAHAQTVDLGRTKPGPHGVPPAFVDIVHFPRRRTLPSNSGSHVFSPSAAVSAMSHLWGWRLARSDRCTALSSETFSRNRQRGTRASRVCACVSKTSRHEVGARPVTPPRPFRRD